MADRVLLDVNVCLDVLLKREPFWEDSAKIFLAAERDQIAGRVSAISFDTMFYILRSDLGSAKAQAELKRLRTHIQISAVDTSVVDHALNAEWSDLEDALQYYSAKFSKCKAIITRNKRDYPKKSNLPIFTPVEFISSYL
ncbi:MAG: PIN domain-containing protein [Balneolaceae bacterium]|nr:PIN domain-containing protein [Balneolaceae bacterium]